MTLPARCTCGWVLPAAFQVMAPDAPRLPYPKGAMLLFACGNCGVWRNCALSTRGGAHTPNAAGFGNMGVARVEGPRAIRPDRAVKLEPAPLPTVHQLCYCAAQEAPHYHPDGRARL